MRSFFLFLLAFIVSAHANAQERVWKKQVTRMIQLADTSVKKTGIKDSSLLMIIYNAAQAGKTIVYSPYEDGFVKTLNTAGLSDIFFHQDTVMLIDPIDGHEVMKIMKGKQDVGTIHQFKIWEEWTFNPGTGKAQVQIKYIGPVRDIYGDDGLYRGHQTLFWISYKDLSVIAGTTAGKQAMQALHSPIFNSNFKTDLLDTPDPANGWNAVTQAMVTLPVIYDSGQHYLQDEYMDTSLAMLATAEVMKGKMQVWQDAQLKIIMPDSIFKMHTSKIDTSLYTDPIDGSEMIKVYSRNITGSVINYLVSQEWHFDPDMGVTTIETKSIAPMQNRSQHDQAEITAIVGWLSYKDLLPIMIRKEQYYPTNHMILSIWNNFFLSDTKPVMIK